MNAPDRTTPPNIQTLCKSLRGGEGAAGDPVYRSGAKAKPTQSETARARRLRRTATDAETLLWSRLRGRQLGAKFRRQEPVLGYTADFVAHRHRLIVEVDGGQHASQAGRDERRTRALEQAGYRVLRFWNNDVLLNLDGVIETILQAVDAPLPPGERLGEGGEAVARYPEAAAFCTTPSPRPSPRGGEGEEGGVGR